MSTQSIHPEPFIDQILAYLDRLDRNIRCEIAVESPRHSGNFYICMHTAVVCSIESELHMCADCAEEAQ